MHKLIEYACEELEALEKKAAKGSLSAAEVEYAEKLASLKKNLLKGEEMMEESEYSNADGQSYRGGNSYRYDDGMMSSAHGGNSYARNGRGRGSNARRDSMGRYSSRGGYSRAEGDMAEIVEELRGMMDSLPEDKQREVQRFIEKVDRM